MNESKVLNIKKSKVDRRDNICFATNTKYPKKIDMRSKLGKVRNQGVQGSCFAFATSTMKEYQEKNDYNFEGYMSPQFFYDNRPNLYDADENNDEGMYGRDVMKLLQNVGICREEEYPYGNPKSKDEIDKSLYESAKKHTCGVYSRIYEIDALKEALNRNGPCLICFPVYNFSEKMWKKEEDSVFMGGHAMVCVGYTENSFIIRNSWGEEWGDKGYCYYPFEEWDSHWEIWTIEDNKTKSDDKKFFLALGSFVVFILAISLI